MPNKSFRGKLDLLWNQNKFVCVGLDSDLDRLPKSIKGKPQDRIFKFNKAIIDETHDLVLAYKPNCAFYEAAGTEGLEALKKTIDYIHKKSPDVLVILDAKRADIGSTNEGYAKFAFDYLKSDAITVHPYLGKEALKPFLDRKDKGLIILVKTSNPGSGEFQDLEIEGKPLFLKIAKNIVKNWNENGNVGMVVGATYPKELAIVRKIAPDIPFLIPGIGAQGGNLEETVKAGADKNKKGMIINSSRDIIFAGSGPDFADVARQKVIELNKKIIEALK